MKSRQQVIVVSRVPSSGCFSNFRVVTQSKPVSLDQVKTKHELRIDFRPVSETFKDVVSWYKENNWLSFEWKPEASTRTARASPAPPNTRIKSVEPFR
jgi:hypothetical protein